MSLEVLDLSGDEDRTRYGGQDNRHKFTGGIPSEWGALANLKELKMPNSGLDGKRSAPGLSFAELCADSRHFSRQAAFLRSLATLSI